MHITAIQYYREFANDISLTKEKYHELGCYEWEQIATRCKLNNEYINEFFEELTVTLYSMDMLLLINRDTISKELIEKIIEEWPCEEDWSEWLEYAKSRPEH